MIQRVDLAIVGGGPAGAACALEAARRGRSVALLDRGGDNDKPCGEGIMPGGVDVLRALGLERLLARGRPFTGIRHVVWGGKPLLVDLPRPGLALRRTELMAGLDAALGAARGVVRLVAEGTAEPGPQGYVLDAGGSGPLLAHTLVAADGTDGRAAPWLRSPRSRHGETGRFGLRARFVQGSGLDRVEVHLGRGCEVYLTPLPDAEINVAVLFERPPEGVRGTAPLLAWALGRHPDAARGLGACLTPPAARALPDVRPAASSRAGSFLAGDAGGSLDPIVGCGVAVALRTGVLAARAADAFLAGRDPARVDRDYAAAFARECSARRMLSALLRGADSRPRLARLAVAVLARLPTARRALARVAGGR